MPARKVAVRLHWRTPAEGGRAAPPPGPRFSTVATFDPPTPRNEAWSIVLEWPTAPSAAYSLRFLVGDQAPEYLLQPGARFWLHEGRRISAEGEVLGDWPQ